jgi:hypothetical protein
MTQYRIQRADISECIIEANSPEEAARIANENPDYWSYQPGDIEVTEVSDE